MEAIYPGLLTPLDQMSLYLRSHLRYPEDLFNDQAQAYAQVHITDPSVFFQGADLFNIAQESLNGSNQATTAYYVELTLPGTSTPQFVLLQTFSPGASGSGNAANNMTAWLAAECDYTGTDDPKLVSVRLNNAETSWALCSSTTTYRRIRRSARRSACSVSTARPSRSGT